MFIGFLFFALAAHADTSPTFTNSVPTSQLEGMIVGRATGSVSTAVDTSQPKGNAAFSGVDIGGAPMAVVPSATTGSGVPEGTYVPASSVPSAGSGGAMTSVPR
jgi:hypothetical protein